MALNDELSRAAAQEGFSLADFVTSKLSALAADLATAIQDELPQAEDDLQRLITDALAMVAEQTAEQRKPVAASLSAADEKKLRRMGLSAKYSGISNETELRELREREAEKK